MPLRSVISLRCCQQRRQARRLVYVTERNYRNFIMAIFMDELVEPLFSPPRCDHVGTIFDESLGQCLADPWLGQV